MKRYFLFLTVFLTANSYAVDAKRLAQKSGCLACHSVDKKVLGPAFSSVAAKYKDDPNYLTTLSNKVKNGGSGVWGPMPMPSNKQISDENIATLVTWIVTGIEPSTNPNPTTTANSSTTKSNSSSGSAVLGVLGAVAGVYLENQASKSNSRSRNAQASQTVPQIETRTQTSQNSYSSNNTNDTSVSKSKLGNPSSEVHDCLKVSHGTAKSEGRPGLLNTCPFKVYFTFCVENPVPIDPAYDPKYFGTHMCTDASDGVYDNVRVSDPGYNSTHIFSGKYHWFACKYPSRPLDARFYSLSSKFTAICS